MNLFYQKEISPSTENVHFDKDESKHIAKVLRKKEGDILNITNGKGFMFECKLIHSDPKNCNAVILNYNEQAQPLYKLHLAVAPTKLNDRFEWFLEKATEIGVSEITPLFCENSERKIIKPERYEKIIIGAMKQSLKAYLPTLNPLITFHDFIKAENRTIESLKCIAHCEDSGKESLKSILRPTRDVTILIGPEGDFSSTEIEAALKAGFHPISLGENRLRTETAAVVACHSVAFINET